MGTPLYLTAFRESWKILWKHKVLWIFGLFATFLGQAGIGDIVYKLLVLGFNRPLFIDTFFIPKNLIDVTTLVIGLSLPMSEWLVLFWVGLLFLGIICFFIFIALVSQGAIIFSAARLSDNKSINTSVAWHAGVQHSGRLFLVNLLKKSITMLLTSLVALSLIIIFTSFNILTLASFVFVLILAIIIGMVVSFLAIYTSGYIVVENYSFLQALSAAWALFTNHALVSLEVGVLVLAVNFITMILGAAALFIFFVLPVVALWFLAIFTGFAALKLASIVFAALLAILVLAFIGSLFTIFSTSVWTFLFVKMHKEGIGSHLIHLMGIKN